MCMRDESSRQVSNMLDFLALPHGKLLTKKTCKNRGRGKDFPPRISYWWASEWSMVAHAEDSGSSSLLPPFILNFAPIPPPLCHSTVTLLCLSRVLYTPRFYKRMRMSSLLRSKRYCMCSFISLRHQKNFQEKRSFTDAACTSQILFKNMKWSEIRIHTHNIHRCEAHCSGAHPTFLSRSHPSSPLWFSDLIIPLTLLSTSQTGFSIFYLVFQNQYCWQKCFCLIPHYLCHATSTSGGFCSWWTATSQLFASCPPMPQPHHFQRIEKFDMNCCNYCEDRLREREREIDEKEKRGGRWKQIKIYIHSL